MFRCDGYEVIKLFRRAGLLLGFENEDHVSCARLPSMCRSGAFIVSLGGEASQRVIAEGEKRERGREGGGGVKRQMTCAVKSCGPRGGKALRPLISKGGRGFGAGGRPDETSQKTLLRPPF